MGAARGPGHYGPEWSECVALGKRDGPGALLAGWQERRQGEQPPPVGGGGGGVRIKSSGELEGAGDIPEDKPPPPPTPVPGLVLRLGKGPDGDLGQGGAVGCWDEPGGG